VGELSIQVGGRIWTRGLSPIQRSPDIL